MPYRYLDQAVTASFQVSQASQHGDVFVSQGVRMFRRLTIVNVLQEGEISSDLFKFHEAVSQLQLLEDEVLDAHASLAEMGPLWTGHDHALLAMTNDVDYDQDGEIIKSCNHRSTQNKQLHGCRNYFARRRCHSSQKHSRPLALETVP
jgi:hypothetical protein